MAGHRWERQGYACVGLFFLEQGKRPPDDILHPAGEAEARILACDRCGLVLAHWSIPDPPTMRRAYAYGMELDALAVHPGRIPGCNPLHREGIGEEPPA